MIFVLFLVLKLTHVVGWSWWWILLALFLDGATRDGASSRR